MTNEQITAILCLEAERDVLLNTLRDLREGCAPRSVVRVYRADYDACVAKIAAIYADYREAA